METTKSDRRLPLAIAATTALLSAGLAPMAAAPQAGTHLAAAVSAEVALVGNAVVDGLADLTGLGTLDVPTAAELPGAAEAFDFVGLFNAEVAAAQGFFNSLFSLPGTLFNDVQNVIDSLVNLDFGMAFSEAVTIPQDIINYVLGLPGLVINTVFNMVVVLPGEYLFNFG